MLLIFLNNCGGHGDPPVIAISVVLIGRFSSFCLAIKSTYIVGVPWITVHLQIIKITNCRKNSLSTYFSLTIACSDFSGLKLGAGRTIVAP